MINGIDFILEHDLMPSGGHSQDFSYFNDVTPDEFISFAEEDLKEGTKRGLVNALSNIKRNIHCQVDLLLNILGNPKKTKLDFPSKIKFLNEIGIISPRILKKINTNRNFLEHEYILPKKEELDDFIDVANLFLGATHLFTRKICTSFTFCSKEDSSKQGFSCSLEWNPEKNIYNFYYTTPSEGKIKVVINPTKKENLNFIKLYVQIVKEN